MRAAYATWTPATTDWRVTAYDDGAPLPLLAEGMHGSAYDPRVTGSMNAGLREAGRILTGSGLATAGPWTAGPQTPEAAEYRITLAPPAGPRPVPAARYQGLYATDPLPF